MAHKFEFSNVYDASKIMLVNNTGADVEMFKSAIFDAIKNDSPLPEEIADLFTLEIIYVNGQKRGILEFA